MAICYALCYYLFFGPLVYGVLKRRVNNCRRIRLHRFCRRASCIIASPAHGSLKMVRTPSGRSLLGSVRPDGVTVDRGSADAMLRTAATCLAAGVEAGYDLALGIEDLGLFVDSKAAIGIQHANARASRVEGRGVDSMQDGLVEV